MTIYIMIFLLGIGLLYLQKQLTLNIFPFLLILIVLFQVVFGLRYGVGKDYFNYLSAYQKYKMVDSYSLLEEPGVVLIAKLTASIKDNNFLFMFNFYLVYTVLFLRFLSVLKKDQIFIYIYFFSYGLIFMSLNVTRQSISALSLLLSVHFFTHDSSKFFLYFLISIAFHKSSIFLFLILYLGMKLIRKRKVIFYTFLIAVLFLKYNISGMFLLPTFSRSMTSSIYFQKVNPIRVILHNVIPFLIYIFYREKEKLSNDEFYFFIILMNFYLGLLLSTSVYLYRIIIYFNYLSLYPIMTIKNKINIKNKFLIHTYILFLILFSFIDVLMTPSLSTYQWIFSQ